MGFAVGLKRSATWTDPLRNATWPAEKSWKCESEWIGVTKIEGEHLNANLTMKKTQITVGNGSLSGIKFTFSSKIGLKEWVGWMWLSCARAPSEAHLCASKGTHPHSPLF